MKPVEVIKDIYWVGAIDWNIRDFHGYSTDAGTTYNAYLVMDEKVTLVDTVKKGFEDEMLERISHIIDPKKIDIVISNHTEMDHSGGLPRIMHNIGEDKPLYVSKMGIKNHGRHFKQKWNYQEAPHGGEINIGKRNLAFLETRMLHWPDSMFTYVKEDKLLFSSDAFGQHYASLNRFDDEVGHKIMPHCKKYFANILLLYSPLILKLVDTVTELGLEINTICPDHGVIWRQDPGKIINAYVEWSKQVPKKKAVIIYDSMWHSTQTMAEVITEALGREGVEARPMHIRSSHRSEIMTEILDAGAIIVGSPTLNNGLFPTVADILTYIKGLKPQNKVGAAFGSYGWSGEAVKLINQELEAMKIKIVDDGVKLQFVPEDKGMEACEQLARNVAAAMADIGG